MYLTDELNMLRDRLISEDSLSGIRVIYAYPYIMKPTRLSSPVITLSPASVDAKSVSLGCDCFYGCCCIDIDVFSPFEMGSPCMTDIMRRVISCAADEGVAAIKVSEATADESSGCFTAKCTLTYNKGFRTGRLSNAE